MSFFLFKKIVGKDEFGNSYYVHGKKRLVKYHGIAEPSKIPSHWHLWLHYVTDKIPNKAEVFKYHWQKIHLPNLTGTVNAYKKPKFDSEDFTNFTDKKYSAWNGD